MPFEKPVNPRIGRHRGRSEMRWFVFALALLLALGSADARMGSVDSNYNRAIVSSGYSGLGDLVSGASEYYSCGRAYTSAYAASNGKLCNIIRASDSETCDILAASTGGSGVTTNCSGSDNGETLAVFLSATTGTWTEAYDQTGNGHVLTQATGSKQPGAALSCLGSLPCISTVGASSQVLAGTGANLSQPYTIVLAALNSDSTGNVLMMATGNCAPVFMGWQNATTSNFDFYAGSDTSVAGATHNALHFYQFVANGASSVGNIDGADNTISSGTDATGTSLALGACTGFGYSTSQIAEMGVWPAGFSSGQRSSIYSNMSSYW